MSKPQVFYGVLIGTALYEIVWLTELKTAVRNLGRNFNAYSELESERWNLTHIVRI